MDDRGPLPYRVPAVRSDPSLNRWFVRIVVLRSEGVAIGNAGFHGPPDADGMIEIGLTIHEAYRNRGFAKETVTGLWRWGCAQPGVRTLRWTCVPDNAASIAVVESFGFSHVGEQMDEEDGLELIYELPAAEFVRVHGLDERVARGS